MPSLKYRMTECAVISAGKFAGQLVIIALLIFVAWLATPYELYEILIPDTDREFWFLLAGIVFGHILND